MDLNQFKPKNGERIIVVENGKAEFVLLSFEDYQKNYLTNPVSVPAAEPIIQKENPITSQKAKLEEKMSFPEVPEEPNFPSRDGETVEEKTELTLDDLPF